MAKTIDFLASDDEQSAPMARSAKPALRKRPAVKSTGLRKRRRPDDDSDQGDDGDDNLDIASSLLPELAPVPKANGKQKEETVSNWGPRASIKRAIGNDDEDDASFIASVMQQANVKAGIDVAKKAMSSKGKNKSTTGIVTGGGSFQSMGLHPALLRSLLIRGFTTPTPIQRQAVPAIMSQPPRDVVGMARTGSGKTLAYLIPLINRLNGRHSTTFGIKSLILCPSRELAVQILRVGKEIARGWKSDPGEGQDSKGEAIRWAMIVGGESLDEQFSIMSNNPDVVIATPGRMLHLTVEMNLDLKAVDYVVFDEADRLFEMGFAEQLEEMLLRLPPTRQTLLFSATLPKKLVEFAKAGLQANPKLVRLDADSKISSDLRMAFFSVKPSEKEAALLVLLRDVIGVPMGEQAAPDPDEEGQFEEQSDDDTEEGGKPSRGGKSSRGGKYGFGATSRDKGWKGKDANGPKKPKRAMPAGGALQLLPHQTIIFCATKHHVEYLLLLLKTAGYACSHIYSSLDQATRGIQMSRFRRGQTSLLIVTDVAARGIDLPVLEHVVNFDFPPQPRTFVHRVGRTARAGRNGWAWTMCTNAELPYLCDLQLFLARPLISSHTATAAVEPGLPLGLHETLVLGTLPREALDLETEFIASALTNASSSTANDFPAMKQVADRAQQKYEKSIAKASQESHRRAKEMIKAGSVEQIHARRRTAADTAEGEIPEWTLAGSPLEETAVHDVIARPITYGLKGPQHGDAAKQLLGLPVAPATAVKVSAAKEAEEAAARAALLAKVNAFRPHETVFEIGARGDAAPLAALMKSRRQTMDVKSKRADAAEARKLAQDGSDELMPSSGKTPANDVDAAVDVDLEQADEDDLAGVFDTGLEPAMPKDAPSAAKKARTTKSSTARPSFKDPNFYLSYEQEGARAEKGYSMGNAKTGIDSFAQQASSVSFDLAGDEATLGTQSQRPNVTRWDSKKKKFIQGAVGADNKKMIRTESGVRLPASFRSGRFEDWKREKRVDMPKTGEQERGGDSSSRGGGRGGSSVMGLSKFRHNSFTPSKAEISANTILHGKGYGKGRPGQHKRQAAAGLATAAARDEVKSARQIQKERDVLNKRREKNARPSSGGSRGGRGGRGGSRGGGGGRGGGGRGGGRGGGGRGRGGKR